MRQVHDALRSWWKEERRQHQLGQLRGPQVRHALLALGLLAVVVVRPVAPKLLLAVVALGLCRAESQLRFRRERLQQLRESRQSSQTLQRTSRQLEDLGMQLGLPPVTSAPGRAHRASRRAWREEQRQRQRRLNHVAMQLDGLQQAARALAMIDPLTRLPNRNHFLRTLQLECARAQRAGTGLVVMAINIDRFRSLSDTYGHEIADQVLVQVARRLQATVRPSDVLTRFDNDGFALLMDLSGLSDFSMAGLRLHSHQFANRLVEGFREGIPVNDTLLNLSVNVGVNLVDPSQSGQDSIVRTLARAVGAAGQQTYDRVAIHAGPSADDELDDYRLFNALKETLRHRSLQMAFQPVLTAQGTWYSVEALARWHPRGLGPIAPDRFIAVAERFRLMDELGEQILTLAVEGFQQILQELPLPDLRLSVNMSPSQLNNPDVHRQLGEIVARAGLDPTRVTLEITERAVLDQNAVTTNNLKQLRSSGFRLSLDDFGTGFSSLNLLNSLRPDEIKIDRIFIEPLHRDPYARRIVSLIAGMASELQLQLVAEGVEDEATFRSLCELGIPRFQGFWFQRPVSAIGLILAGRGQMPDAQAPAPADGLP
jgi:diguanylate cyclase (GGDEF)-like protein